MNTRRLLLNKYNIYNDDIFGNITIGRQYIYADPIAQLVRMRQANFSYIEYDRQAKVEAKQIADYDNKYTLKVRSINDQWQQANKKSTYQVYGEIAQEYRQAKQVQDLNEAGKQIFDFAFDIASTSYKGNDYMQAVKVALVGNEAIKPTIVTDKDGNRLSQLDIAIICTNARLKTLDGKKSETAIINECDGRKKVKAFRKINAVTYMPITNAEYTDLIHTAYISVVENYDDIINDGDIDSSDRLRHFMRKAGNAVEHYLFPLSMQKSRINRKEAKGLKAKTMNITCNDNDLAILNAFTKAQQVQAIQRLTDEWYKRYEMRQALAEIDDDNILVAEYRQEALAKIDDKIAQDKQAPKRIKPHSIEWIKNHFVKMAEKDLQAYQVLCRLSQGDSYLDIQRDLEIASKTIKAIKKDIVIDLKVILLDL